MHRIALKSGDNISLKNTDTGETILLEIASEPLGRGAVVLFTRQRQAVS